MSRSLSRLRRLVEAVDPRVDLLHRRYLRRVVAGALRRRLGGREPGATEDAWHEARGRRARGVPPTWRDVPTPELPAAWAVVLHSDSGDLDAALGDLAVIHEAFDLFVVGHGSPEPRPCPPTAARTVHYLPPVAGGADGALVALVNAGFLDPYAVVLRTTSAARGRLCSLGGAGTAAVLDAFAHDRGLGLVTDDGGWQTTRPRDVTRGAAELLARIAVQVPESPFRSPSGTDFWARGFLLQGLRSMNLSQADVRPGQTTGSGSKPPLGLVLGAVTAEAGCTVLGLSDEGLRAEGDARAPVEGLRARVVPFYLPQFHPIEENDASWGPGFTEWSNTTTAQPVYRHHYQPKLPHGLGFYDLRVDDTRERQARLARRHGISGFMYYYYWFAGRRVLSQPIEALRRGDTDFPFCVMWANENWTRSWDGQSQDVLLAQRYDEVPAELFIDDLLPFLSDPRYIRVGDRALVAVYRPGQIPELAQVVAHWRRVAREEGIELYLLSVDVGADYDGLDSPAAHGFDGHLGFPPHQHAYRPARSARLKPSRRFTGNLWDYHALVRGAEDRLRAGLDADAYPTVMVDFDNTARRQWQASVFVGSNPYTFRRWLEAAVAAVEARAPERRIVFVNAWNEWAEGAVLEPTTRSGATYLQAVRDVVAPRSSE